MPELEFLGVPVASVDVGSEVVDSAVGVTVMVGTLVAIAGALIETLAPLASVSRDVAVTAEGLRVAAPVIPLTVGRVGAPFWRLCLWKGMWTYNEWGTSNDGCVLKSVQLPVTRSKADEKRKVVFD
jgi:hypothetical protein